MDLAGVADELYGLPLEEFTKARNERSKQAKAEGDKELSDTIKALPKPSVAPWVVNMLVRHQADQLDQVLALGESLRQAQADLDGEQLRELDKQRRQLTSAITAQARALAAELGQKVSDAVATQVQETLHAAMAEEDAATAVRTGQLVEPLASTGFGPVDLAGVVGVPSLIGQSAKPAKAARKPVTQPATESATEQQPDLAVVEDDTRAREEAETAVADAEAAAAKAEKKLTKAQKRIAKLEAKSLQLQGELEELRRRIGEVEHELESVDEELDEAEAKREAAAERRATADRALDEARTERDRLG